jgi:hypothetical protein
VPTQATPQGVVEWQAIRLTGQDALAVRASKKLKADELLVAAFAGTRLRMELDKVPLWRGDHVPIKQLVEDFARYLYLPRLADPTVLRQAIADGLALLTWEREAFAYAESHDEAAGRCRRLHCGQRVSIADGDTGLLVRLEAARRHLDAEAPPAPTSRPREEGATPAEAPRPGEAGGGQVTPAPRPPAGPRRFHGSVRVDPTRLGRDAGQIAQEVVQHLTGMVGAKMVIALEIQAEIPNGAPDNVVRAVTENCRTLKFTTHGFEHT